jgi:hypothetical protein
MDYNKQPKVGYVSQIMQTWETYGPDASRKAIEELDLSPSQKSALSTQVRQLIFNRVRDMVIQDEPSKEEMIAAYNTPCSGQGLPLEMMEFDVDMDAVMNRPKV